MNWSQSSETNGQKQIDRQKWKLKWFFRRIYVFKISQPYPNRFCFSTTTLDNNSCLGNFCADFHQNRSKIGVKRGRCTLLNLTQRASVGSIDKFVGVLCFQKIARVCRTKRFSVSHSCSFFPCFFFRRTYLVISLVYVQYMLYIQVLT